MSLASIPKLSTLTTAVAVAIPLFGIGNLYKKYQKLKNEGKITSFLSLISSIPVVWRTKRFIFMQTKFRNNKHLARLGNPKIHFASPKFKLSDHWKSRETDVICSVPEKSGTTWALQMCHQLRIGGDSNINYNQCILDVCPWVERQLLEHFAPMADKAIKPDPAAGPGAEDMNADHVDGPIRVFKSHLPLKKLEGLNCKIIYFYRYDVDVIYSGYRFFCVHMFEVGDIVTPHQYATIRIFQGLFENSLRNLCNFWEHRNDPKIGFFFYDDVKEDHRGSLIRIAKLMGIEPTKELVDKVVEQSTVKFMSSDDHHLRFDGFTVISNIKRAALVDYSYWPARSGLPPQGSIKGKNLKVAKGGGLGSKTKKKVQPGRELVEECFKKTWDHIVLPRTGFKTYQDMRSAWTAERSKLSTQN